MVPIVYNANEDFTEEKLMEFIINQCQNHHQTKRALVFAFLVYDFEDYTIHQILDNKQYWTTLDKLSGYFLSIFYINSRNSYFKERQKEIHLQRIANQIKVSNMGLNQMLVPINTQKSALDESIDFIKKEFAIEESVQHPFILFFQTEGDLIIDYFVVSLKQEKLEEAFLELKMQIKNAVIALSRITPENYNNHKEIFDQVKFSVQGANIHHYIKTKIIPSLNVKTLLTFIRILSSGS